VTAPVTAPDEWNATPVCAEPAGLADVGLIFALATTESDQIMEQSDLSPVFGLRSTKVVLRKSWAKPASGISSGYFGYSKSIICLFSMKTWPCLKEKGPMFQAVINVSVKI
jgi:hypothetical protein